MNDQSVPQLFDLTGRTALVTGASGHLGRSLASALAEAGATVVCASRDAERAAQSAARLPTPGGGKHHSVVLDHFDEHLVQQGFAAAVETVGTIDILVNNGQQSHPLDLTNVTADAFNRDLQNLTGYFLLARQLHDHVAHRGTAGSIVMVGSMYGCVGSYPDAYEGVCPASPVQYHATKGGVVQMTRHLAVYWANDNVRVNCLSPGPFPGPTAPPEMVERLRQKSPLRRMGRPDELKGPLLLLASDAGSYITGQNILVDGGWTAW